MTTCIKGARVDLAPFFISAGLVFGSLAASAQAEVPVVDLGGRQVTVTPATPSATPSSYATTYSAPTNKPEQLGILFSQLQTLQQEMAELRGLIEQQQNELQQLKQQQKDNYLDVDRRLAELHQQQPAAATPALSPAPMVPTAASASNEKDSYDKAYNLLDKNQKDEATLAFRKHILLYPQGELTPNAYYWLGQIYLSQAQLAEAEEQLTTLLKQYPQHHKAMDAKFALGKVFFQQGKKPAAQKLIQEVAQSDSAAAALAKKYLQDNF